MLAWVARQSLTGDLSDSIKDQTLIGAASRTCSAALVEPHRIGICKDLGRASAQQSDCIARWFRSRCHTLDNRKRFVALPRARWSIGWCITSRRAEVCVRADHSSAVGRHFHCVDRYFFGLPTYKDNSFVRAMHPGRRDAI